MQTGTDRLGKFFNVELAHANSCSFWNISRFRSLYCSQGMVINATNQVYGDASYFNSNNFSIEVWGFITNPLILSALSGEGSGECSDNIVELHIQPADRTESGVRLLGGDNARRNHIKGIIWDWLDSYGWAVIDRGMFTEFSNLSKTFIQTSQLSSGAFVDTNPIHARPMFIPGDSNGRMAIGAQDNILAFSDRKFTVTGDEPTYGALSTLFSLDNYRFVGWNDVPLGETREIIIEWDEATRVTSAASCGYYSANPTAITIEYKDTNGTWYEVFSGEELYEQVNGIFSPYSVNSGVDILGIKYTFGDGRRCKYDVEDIPKRLSPTGDIYIVSLYATSPERNTPTSFCESFRPRIIQGAEWDVIESTVSGEIISKIKAYDANGSFVGYIPVYAP